MKAFLTFHLLLLGLVSVPAATASGQSSIPSNSATGKQDAPLESFAGIWQGGLFRSGSGNTDGIVVFVNPKKKTATVSHFFPGPQTGRVRIDGNTLEWKWLLATWKMTISGDGRTAAIDADSPFEACRGTLTRRSDH